MRVAIVGFGPKGLFALERLLDHAARPGCRVEVDLFDPAASPAAGPNYDPQQPDYLRMNFAAALVDMWWPGSGAVAPAARLSYVEWAAANGDAVDPGSYPSRASVGRYLCEGFDALLRHAPESISVRLVPASVERVSFRDAAWELASRRGVDGPYDEVLVATGHGQGSPYPVEHWLGPDRVPPGAVVGVRGFGLTFIDAALALTEGRGGAFTPLDHPFRLRFEPAPDAVAAILPYSRRGRPMLAKPDPSIAASVGALDAVARRGCSALTELAGPVELARDVLPILERAISASLAAASPGARAEPGAWLASASSGRRVASGRSARGELEQSLLVGCGRARPDLPWALGHVWRTLYPAIVERLGGDGLVGHDWPAFRQLAGEFERVAFGPAPINAAKLLALVDAGRVDLAQLGGLTRPVDVVVDAVLPGPGVTDAHDAPAARLVADGYARVASLRRGLDVDADGSCRAADGAPVAGLAAIGRPTEDSVIGNDTLNRTLHPLADRWARRVVRRAEAT